MSTTVTSIPTRRFTRGPDADAALLRNAAAGDDHAFESFYHRHADALLGYCRHLLGSRQEAEDAVQQTFFSAYREIAAGRLPDKPKAWLYAIARNRSLSTIRARREQPSELVDRPAPELTEVVERRADLRQLVLDLHRLPEDQRSAIVLFELAGMAQADIADVLGREPDQVRALVYQARTTLMAGRSARELACERVREQIAVSRGGQLNSRMLRRHVEGCEECAAYLEEERRQRRSLAIVLPFAPAVLAPAATGTSSAGAIASLPKLHRLHHLMRPAAAGAAGVCAAAAIAVAVAAGGGEKPKPARAAAAPASGASAPAKAPPVAAVKPLRSFHPTHGKRHPTAPARHRASGPTRKPAVTGSPAARPKPAPPAGGREPNPPLPRPQHHPQPHHPSGGGSSGGGSTTVRNNPPTPPAPTPPVGAPAVPDAPSAPDVPATPDVPDVPTPPTGGGHTNNGHHYGWTNGNHGNGNGGNGHGHP